MEKVTVSLEERHLYELRAQERLGNAGSRSGALRQILDEYGELRTEYSELEAECEELRRRCDAREERIEELEDQLRSRSDVEEKIEALPDKIRERGTYQERRQRLLDEASLAQRVKWKVTGVPVDQIEGDEGGGSD
jgi:predicted RNase H-like nuclease (RuvC/YqgF family)